MIEGDIITTITRKDNAEIRAYSLDPPDASLIYIPITFTTDRSDAFLTDDNCIWVGPYELDIVAYDRERCQLLCGVTFHAYN